MAQKDTMLLGTVLCKGAGLRTYLEVPMSKKRSDGTIEHKVFRYEIGNLQQILAETNRQSEWTRVIGRKNPVGNSQGLIST